MRRGLAVGAVVLLVGASAGLGWWFGRGIRSPAQIAAEAEPPEPSLITVEVERRELSANVITRADVGYDAPAILSLGGALGGRPDVLVVTAAPKRGEDLAEGSAAIEIAGRPVFLLVGDIPVFRDMRPGIQGPDVLQVEQALARLGFFAGAPDQRWDDDTGEAVEAWYQANGYQANGVSEQEKTALRTARTRVRTASDGLNAARKALREARNPGEGAVRGARAAVADAQQALDELLDPPADEVRRARAAVTAAAEARQAAETKIADDDAAAEEAVTAAQRARERAAQSYAQAEQNWRSAQMGVHPGTGALPTPADLNALRLAVDGARIELDAAEQAITEARETLDQRPAAAATELRHAGNALLNAQEALDGLMNPTEKAQRTARNRLLDAQDALARLLAPPDIADKQRQVQDAETELADVTQALADLEAETGTWLPSGEIIFLRRMPVRVDALTAEQGSLVSGGFMTVTGSDLAVRGSVLARDIRLVEQGGEARIEDAALSDPIPGTIRLLENRSGTRGVSSDRHYMEIVADEIPDELIGSNVRVVIPVGGTEGEVWAVPAAALSATADGATRIEIAQPDGTARFVEVEPGLAAQGLVEVTPLDAEIAPGDQVVVGVASGE